VLSVNVTVMGCIAWKWLHNCRLRGSGFVCFCLDYATVWFQRNCLVRHKFPDLRSELHIVLQRRGRFLILSLRTLYVGSLGLLMPCCNQQEGVPVCGSCDFSKQEACGDTYSACTGTLCAQHSCGRKKWMMRAAAASRRKWQGVPKARRLGKHNRRVPVTEKGSCTQPGGHRNKEGLLSTATWSP
jgi:hypothetical protein